RRVPPRSRTPGRCTPVCTHVGPAVGCARRTVRLTGGRTADVIPACARGAHGRVDPAHRRRGGHGRVDPAHRTRGARRGRVDPAHRTRGARRGRVDPAHRTRGARRGRVDPA